MTDKPAPQSSYAEEAAMRSALRMKAEYLTLVSLTIGSHNLRKVDFDYLADIDRQCATMSDRMCQHSISGNPPLTQSGSGARFHEEYPEPAPANPFDLTGAAPATEAPAAEMPGKPAPAPSVAERWNGGPLDAATALPAPPPPAAPTEEPPAPVGEIDPEIARGIAELSDDEEGPAFDGMGVRNRGHVTRA